MSQFSPEGPQPSSNPFAAPPPAAPPRTSWLWLWILLGIGAVGLLICCGCLGVGWYGMRLGFNVLEEDLSRQLAGDPVAKEHLGEIQSVSFDMFASGQETESRGEEVLVFQAEGTKGKGKVVGKSPPDGSLTIQDPILILPDGKEVELHFVK